MDLIIILMVVIYVLTFITYLLILMLYKKSEGQRIEITKLTREIAYLKDEKNK